ncbi:uncharacterized protein Triagg1_9330 [Trichoderma aggressivum f. europaeum]|uniref:NADH-ubiquinone oxidoreductase B12 subunit family protein n=1 Tax=Trichoderma aggressivum f. europaeum TaxID=173218 RepID=A0AAE1LX74_9HYPO|nr:hypothetical protein Triagg1_9330 [Trichoderma aggressivum f. europaeum]
MPPAATKFSATALFRPQHLDLAAELPIEPSKRPVEIRLQAPSIGIMLATRALRAAHGPKPNITGFNMRALKEATGQPRYDPWERAEAWRYKGTFSRWNRFRSGFPGLGIASVAFAGYCAYEYLFLDDGHHGEGHGEGHH